MNAFRIDGQRAVVTGGGSYVNGLVDISAVKI